MYTLTYRYLLIKLIKKILLTGKAVHEGCGPATKNVLEFGSGPVPILMLSASRWSDNIISSDYSETSRLKLSQWLQLENKKSDQEDLFWLPFARFVHKLEQEPSSSQKEY